MPVSVCRFFFFQAEDGIRDDLVTGVQTCALPILTARAGARARDRHAASARADLGGAVLNAHALVAPAGTAAAAAADTDAAGGGGLDRAPATHKNAVEIGRASCREKGKKPEDLGST